MVDWWVPRAPKDVPDQRSFIQSSAFSVLYPVHVPPLPVDRMSDWWVPKGPTYVAEQRSYVQSSTFSLLYPVHAPPITIDRMVDWYVPRSPRAKVTDWTFTPAAIFYPAVVVDPFKPSEWRVPRGAQAPAQEVSSDTPLTLYADPIKRTHIWPVPRRSSGNVIDWTNTPALIFYPPPSVNPFQPVDWPNPVQRPTGRQFQTLAPNRNLYPDINPPAYFDWGDVPRGAQRASALRGFELQRSLPAAFAPAPFQPIDWPVPRRAAAKADGGWVNIPSNIFYPAIIGDPNKQTDWPNPVLRAKERRDGSASSSTVLLSSIPPDPLRPIDWPVPRGSRSTQPWVQAWNLLISIQPFNNSDWPNPRGATASVALRSHSLQRSLPATEELPPARFEWSLPRGYRQTVRGYVQAALIEPTPTNPAFAWPVPRRSRAKVEDWTNTPAAIFYGLPNEDPIRPLYWQNPILPARGRQFWTVALNYKLYYDHLPARSRTIIQLQSSETSVKGKPGETVISFSSSRTRF